LAIIRYIVDLSSEISDEINKLIASGKYRSIQDFLAAAASNQLHLEQQGPPQGIIIAPTSPSIEATTIYNALLVRDFGNLKTVSPPNSEQVPGELHGLWNKFFPVKITTRVLANMLKGASEYVPLEPSQERIADIARQLGRVIVRKERDLGRKRGDMISTALPWKREEFKAKMRFKSHFVGHISSDKWIEGAPAALRLTNMIRSNGTVSIGLTAAGLRFASLTNPVIDEENYTASLSQDERAFLIDQIRTELPDETQLMKSVITAVANGSRTPTALNSMLHELKPKLNDTELVTLRSGLLSRMYELNLMQRTRNGLTMTYDVTPNGQAFIGGD
jgi:hypothetical protein